MKRNMLNDMISLLAGIVDILMLRVLGGIIIMRNYGY